MSEISNAVMLISKARAATNKAIADHDIKALSNYWMDDIVIVRGNGSIIITKQQAIKIWEQMFTEEPDVSYVRNHDEIIISRSNLLAWEKGKWQGINTYSNGGYYAAMWYNDNGFWKIKSELFVSL